MSTSTSGPVCASMTAPGARAMTLESEVTLAYLEPPHRPCRGRLDRVGERGGIGEDCVAAAVEASLVIRIRQAPADLACRYCQA